MMSRESSKGNQALDIGFPSSVENNGSCGPACGRLLKLANMEDRGQKTELGSEIKMTVPSLFLSVSECLRYTVK